MISTPVSTPVKTCSRCKETKPIEEFSRQKRSRDGAQYWCKSCFTEDGAEFRRRTACMRQFESDKTLENVSSRDLEARLLVDLVMVGRDIEIDKSIEYIVEECYPGASKDVRSKHGISYRESYQKVEDSIASKISGIYAMLDANKRENNHFFR